MVAVVVVGAVRHLCWLSCLSGVEEGMVTGGSFTRCTDAPPRCFSRSVCTCARAL